MTLRDVGRLSRGAFKPTSVAGYERGERTVSLSRFCQLAELYEAPPGRLVAEVVRRANGAAPIVLDLSSLSPINGLEVGTIAAFVDGVQGLRGGDRMPQIQLRIGDLQVLSAALGRSEHDLVSALRSALVSG